MKSSVQSCILALKNNKLFWPTLAISLFINLSSCQKEETSATPAEEKIVVPLNFNFETTHSLDLSLTVKDFQDKVVSGVVWTAYYSNPVDENGNISDQVDKISSFMTDYNGNVATQLEVPGHVSQIYLVSSYPGYPSPLILDANSKAITQTIYPAGHAGNQMKSVAEFSPQLLFENVSSLGTFDRLGIPAYREATRDIISKQFKDNIATSLPEKVRLPSSVNKAFLADASKANIELIADCEVWLTFVTEGAGYLNSLGYFYYPTNTVPQSIAQVSRRFVIFPNSSLSGSGGGLVEGDKVKLKFYDEAKQIWTDVFPANYTISWFLIPKGFTNVNNIGKVSVATGFPPLYSIVPLNESKTQQCVILFDDSEDKMLIGFEDMQRSLTQTIGDEDFNDALFYATANPIEAIKTDRLNKIVEAVDTDKDGVIDVNDEFPADPKRAFRSYYPAQNTWGSLAYEDMWPSRGDYDFNDVVVDYNTTIVKNASGLVVDVNTNYRFRAAGASYRNAFAVQFNTSPSNVESVSGSRLTAGFFSLGTNGVESNQTWAVIPVVDDLSSLFNGAAIVNTQPGATKYPSVTVPVNVTFKSAIDLSTLGAAPYNPFIVVNKERGKEVHLPGKKPTDLVDMKKLGTGIDLTSFSSNRFYVANQSYPWALHIPVLFEYPIEQKSIDKVFYNFGKWVTSGGTLFPAWYQNTVANADQTLIYK